ncbi:MAG: 4-hydroxy-3-methylbut-2-enyl diphosphate reductase, partial [Deferribacterota bacterium]|nr:4-hydroxy-3-methylbut-2-enyl diphosphate reductase [Deferribacterota bacterium]
MAKNAGFCFGVERAISIAKESLGENGKVYTYGPIIHNPHVVNQLEKSGISVVNDLDNLKKG